MDTIFPFALCNDSVVLTENLPIPQGGKGIFTTIKVVALIPLFLDKHLVRLKIKRKKVFIKKQIAVLLHTNGCSSAAVRISLLKNGDIYLHARTLPQNTTLVTAITLQSTEKLPTIKQMDRSIYTEAEEHARKMNAQVVIFTDTENILETSIANLVSQNEKGDLISPILIGQGLEGITKQLLLTKEYMHEENIPIATTYPLIAINCLRVVGITKVNTMPLINPVPLLERVTQILQEQEEMYANSYNR